jgi:hypothetical protein
VAQLAKEFSAFMEEECSLLKDKSIPVLNYLSITP